MAALTKAQLVALPALNMYQQGEYVAVTPDDDNDLPLGPCLGLNVATAGVAEIVGLAGADPVAIQLVQGWNPCPCRRVRATNLTAAGLVAVY